MADMISRSDVGIGLGTLNSMTMCFVMSKERPHLYFYTSAPGSRLYSFSVHGLRSSLIPVSTDIRTHKW